MALRNPIEPFPKVNLNAVNVQAVAVNLFRNVAKDFPQLAGNQDALSGLLFGSLVFEGDYHRRVAVGGLCGTFQLPAILVGITGRPEPGLLSFGYTRHTGENKSENEKFKNNCFLKTHKSALQHFTKGASRRGFDSLHPLQHLQINGLSAFKAFQKGKLRTKVRTRNQLFLEQ